MIKHIETLEGDGFLEDEKGKTVLAEYLIRIWQEFVENSSGPPVPTLQSADGHVKADACFVRESMGKTLTLHLNDSRRISGFFKDSRGAFLCSGDFF